MDAPELTIKAKSVRTGESIALAVRTGYRLDFNHRAVLMPCIGFKLDTQISTTAPQDVTLPRANLFSQAQQKISRNAPVKWCVRVTKSSLLLGLGGVWSK
jgi:hypothetical protein